VGESVALDLAVGFLSGAELVHSGDGSEYVVLRYDVEGGRRARPVETEGGGDNSRLGIGRSAGGERAHPSARGEGHKRVRMGRPICLVRGAKPGVQAPPSTQ
jgi:hypothetical protein